MSQELKYLSETALAKELKMPINLDDVLPRKLAQIK